MEAFFCKRNTFRFEEDEQRNAQSFPACEDEGGGGLYQALYRKWRPKTFDDVVGQEHITETLKNQVRTGRLSHAYLFTGTRGTGKTTCARILAKAVNCENPLEGNPCNNCRFCRGVDDGSLMDVVEMDAASNNGVDNVRQLRDEAIFSPAAARRRVYIIDEVHMLSASAFNALLKILEEPPEHLMFILATTELNKVPATILSRCQRHAFKRLDTASIVGRLQYVAAQERLDLSLDAAALIAGLSEGGMRDALSMLDQCSGREKIDTDTVYSALGLAGNRKIAALLRYIANHDSGAAVALFNELWREGKNPAAVLGELSTLQRDLLMRAVAPKGGRELLSGGYDEATLSSFDRVFSTAALIAGLDRLQAALNDLRSGQARTVCELCLISLCEPGLNDTLPMLRQRVAALEQALQDGAASSPARPVNIIQEPISEPDAPPFDLPEPPPEPDAPPFDVSAWEPPPEPEPIPAPKPLPTSEPAGNGGLWERIRDRAAGVFPVGISAILTDTSQVNGSLDGDTLTLRVQPGFAMNMLDRPDITAKLVSIAAELAGRPVQVKITDSPTGAPAPFPSESKLNALKKFSIVQFK